LEHAFYNEYIFHVSHFETSKLRQMNIPELCSSHIS